MLLYKMEDLKEEVKVPEDFEICHDSLPLTDEDWLQTTTSSSQQIKPKVADDPHASVSTLVS